MEQEKKKKETVGYMQWQWNKLFEMSVSSGLIETRAGIKAHLNNYLYGTTALWKYTHYTVPEINLLGGD